MTDGEVPRVRSDADDLLRAVHAAHGPALERYVARLTDDPAQAQDVVQLDAWLVADALVSLSPEHRAVVVDAYYHGRSVAEMASAHGVPPGTVKSRMHYALRALRLALQEKGVSS